jgi:tetratricopeptide (TPR) repeat protein
VEIRFQLGRAIALQGRHAEAADVFRELLEREPGYGPAWLELGRALVDIDPSAAVAALESAIAYMPSSDEARTTLSQLRTDAVPTPPPPSGHP